LTLRSVHEELLEEQRQLERRLYETSPGLDAGSTALIAALLLQATELRSLKELLSEIGLRL